MGSDLSENDGFNPVAFWRVDSDDPPNGTYYAKAAPKVLTNTAAHTHTCARAASPDVVVTGHP